MNSVEVTSAFLESCPTEDSATIHTDSKWLRAKTPLTITRLVNSRRMRDASIGSMHFSTWPDLYIIHLFWEGSQMLAKFTIIE